MLSLRLWAVSMELEHGLIQERVKGQEPDEVIHRHRLILDRFIPGGVLFKIYFKKYWQLM